MLNRCPSCQASVLDDDAETCPFCGSPMDPAKAKGFKPAAAKPTPKKPAGKATSDSSRSKSGSGESTGSAVTRPPAAKSTAASRPATREDREDDDPFAADSATAAGAISLSRKPSPQRPQKIVCPMCDTAGYAPVAASGKDVRCSNPNCMVPVFTAPDFAAPKPAAKPPEPSAFKPATLVLSLLGLLVVGGAVVWYVYVRQPDRPAPGSPVTSTPVIPPPNTGAPANGEQPVEPTPEVDPGPAPPTGAETLAAIVQRVPAFTEDITQPNRQNLLRRYGAEVYALAGNLDAARAEVEKLQSGRSPDPFYAIAPLAAIAQQQASAGDDAGARASIEASLPMLARIPQTGFDPARVVVEWAAAAARFGQETVARQQATTARSDSAGEQLLARLSSASLHAAGDLDVENDRRPVWNWSQPKSAAIANTMLVHGAHDAAKTWAAAVPDATARAEILAVWAEAVAADARRPAAERMSAINAAVAASGVEEKTLVLARAAIRLAATGDTAAAESLLASAVEGAGQIPAAEPFLAPDMAELHQHAETNLKAIRLRASALAETAHAATLLGQSDQAARLVMQAMDQIRSMAPTPAAMAERRREFQQLGRGGVASQLKTLLNLPSDDRADAAGNEYRRKLDQVEVNARTRFQMQVDLVIRSIEWGLGPQLLAEVKTRNDATDVQQQEGFLSGPAGGRLLAAAHRAADESTVQVVQAANVQDRQVPGPEALVLNLAPQLAKGNVDALAREFAGGNVGLNERLDISIRTACRLLKTRSVSDAFGFAKAHRDEFLREETLRYLSVCAAQSGHAAEVEAMIPSLRVAPSDRASILRGLAEGLVIGGANQAQPPTASAAAALTPGRN